MSQSLHVCKICGKKFATAKALYGHQRIHSELKRIWGLKKPRVCSISTSIESKATSSSSLKRSSSFMTEFEKHEMNEAAMSLVMFSERASVMRNLPPGDIAMDLGNIRHCVESKQESTTCSDVVAQAIPSPLRTKSKTKSNFSYRIKICGKSFERSLGGHQTLHRSNRGQLSKKEDFEVGRSLSALLTDSGVKKVVPQPSCFEVSQEELFERRDTNVKEHSVESRQDLNRGQLSKKEDFEVGRSLSALLTDSGVKKVVPQPSCFEVSQEELFERRDTNVKEHSVESRQDFSKVFSPSSLEESSSYSDVVAQASPFPLRSKLQETSESNSSYKCKVFGKSFGCFQALGGHQKLHRPPSSVILGVKRKRFEDGNSPSGSSEAKKIVPQPSSFEVSQEELIELRDTNVKENSVELKQDFEKLSTCSDVLAQALPSPLRRNIHKRLQSNSSHKRSLKMW